MEEVNGVKANDPLSVEPLCKTCLNKFYFPDCMPKKYKGKIAIITDCASYDRMGGIKDGRIK